MNSLNKVMIIGHLGRDPEVRFTTSGDAVCTLNIATSERFRGKAGEQREATEWHRVVLYRRQAEIARDYLKKGSLVFIEGSLKTRKWTDKNGLERYTTEVETREMKMLGGDGKDGGEVERFNVKKPQAAQPVSVTKPNTNSGDDEWDIPF